MIIFVKLKVKDEGFYEKFYISHSGDFNLQGTEVANPENGIFIKVQGAKAVKVLVK